jgi:hypothetical protein
VADIEAIWRFDPLDYLIFYGDAEAYSHARVADFFLGDGMVSSQKLAD